MSTTKQRVAAALTSVGIIGTDVPMDPHESWLLDAAVALYQDGADIDTIISLATVASQSAQVELGRVLSDLRDGSSEHLALSLQGVRQREITKLFAAIRHDEVVRRIKSRPTGENQGQT